VFSLFVLSQFMPNGKSSAGSSSGAGGSNPRRSAADGQTNEQQGSDSPGGGLGGTELALRDTTAGAADGAHSEAGSDDSAARGPVAPVDPDGVWPLVRDELGLDTSVVYPGSLPSTEEFRSQLHSASLDDLKKIHGILRIRRAGNRADYRSRLETTFAISPVIATLALSCQYCANNDLDHRDKKVLDNMFVGESALATFEEHSLDDLFFRLDKGTFHVGEAEAQRTPSSREGGYHRQPVENAIHFKKSYGGTPEPQTPQDAPWLHGPSLKILIREKAV
jgi:hypothetical protein